MRTINISLPENLAQTVFEEVNKCGFASVSEYIRSLIRNHVIKGETELKFEVFEKKPLKELRRDFERTGLYNKKFIDSLMKGFAQSSLYAIKTPKR